jgi:hypothetical protein
MKKDRHQERRAEMSHDEDVFGGTEEAWETFRNELADRIYTHDEADHVL